jgi:hypothetical protein
MDNPDYRRVDWACLEDRFREDLVVNDDEAINKSVEKPISAIQDATAVSGPEPRTVPTLGPL